MAANALNQRGGHAIDHRQPYRWVNSTAMPTASPAYLFILRSSAAIGPLNGVGNGGVQGLQGIREAYTFDDVLLKPGLSDILPSEADIRSHITRAIPLNIPIIASAMDTVTEARMAIAMAQAGGIGVIHRNFDVEGQAAQVRQVKKFESGMVVNPLTIGPDAMLSDALALMKRSRLLRHSGGHRRGQGRCRASWSAFSPTATCALPPIRGRRSPS